MQRQVARAAASPSAASEWTAWRWIWALALGLAALLCLGGSRAYAIGQAQAAPAQAAPAKAAAATPVAQEVKTKEASGDRGLNTGIKVHGHWVIEVKDPDGKLVSHHEFENSLQNKLTAVSGILSRLWVPGEWAITLGDPNSSPCSANLDIPLGLVSLPVVLTFPDSSVCALTESLSPGFWGVQNCGSGSTPAGCSQNLSLPPTPPNIDEMILTGSVTAMTSGTISQVQTLLNFCNSTITPSACAGVTGSNTSLIVGAETFTAVTLPASNTPTTPCGGANQPSCAVPVSAGQTINVSVTISFQ